MSYFFKLFIFLFILVFIISTFFIPILPNLDTNIDLSQLDLSSNFLQPTPGYTGINSYFGKRVSPTAGASSFHKGVGIAEPEGTKLLAVANGKITFTGFLGGGGYTITLSFGNYKISYCHVSPLILVNTGDSVLKGQILGYVGPKNVYGVTGNTYKDENR